MTPPNLVSHHMSQVTDTHISKSASIRKIIWVWLSLNSFSVEICKEQEGGRNIENENSHRNILQRRNRKDKQKDEERLIEVRVHK